jgi:CheY-like chemotaxis protein
LHQRRQPRLRLAFGERNRLVAPARTAIGRYLEQQGYEVATAVTAEQALGIVRRQKITGMLLDVDLPGMNGVELVPQLLEVEPALAILMLTAVNDATLPTWFQNSLRATWLPKTRSPTNPKVRPIIAGPMTAPTTAVPTWPTHTIGPVGAIRVSISTAGSPVSWRIS